MRGAHSLLRRRRLDRRNFPPSFAFYRFARAGFGRRRISKGGVWSAMSRRDWRKDADYDQVDELDTSGYAWEFLRRNRLYRSDYQAVQGGEDGQDLPGSGGGLAPRWGLRFPGGRYPRRGRSAGLLVSRDRAGGGRSVGACAA